MSSTDIYWGLNLNRSETFTAPGTWTKPATTTQVFVVVIGGGGGGSNNYNAPPFFPKGPGGGGGGGGLRSAVLPVTAPVPVTVGAGGTGGPDVSSPYDGTAGGTTSFGPFSVGGGGAGHNNAPPDGGGGGGTGTSPRYNSPPITLGGAYGVAGTPWGGGGAFRGHVQTRSPSPAFPYPRIVTGWNGHSRGSWDDPFNEQTFGGYGCGGGPGIFGPGTPSPIPATAGTSGVVIVRWNE